MKVNRLSNFRRIVEQPSLSKNKIILRKKTPRKIIELRKKADSVNDMLKSLEKAGNLDSWASKILFNKLGGAMNIINSNGRIDTSSINKKTYKTRLTFIEKSLNEFISSKTSTNKGIKEVINEQRNAIAEKVNNLDFANSLSDDDIKNIYSVFNDEDYDILVESGQYTSEQLYTYITDAVSNELRANDFISYIKKQSEKAKDIEVQRNFRSIYKKYIKHSAQRKR